MLKFTKLASEYIKTLDLLFFFTVPLFSKSGDLLFEALPSHFGFVTLLTQNVLHVTKTNILDLILDRCSTDIAKRKKTIPLGHLKKNLVLCWGWFGFGGLKAHVIVALLPKHFLNFVTIIYILFEANNSSCLTVSSFFLPLLLHFFSSKSDIL